MILSIIVPSYNHEQFVLKTIQAAARIDIQDKEILVIDDGSRDGSVSTIRDYIANRDLTNSVRLIARENRGLVKTLNEGLSLAQGKYLYGVASDDIPIPDGITRLVNQLEKNPSLQFVLGNALFMHSEDQREFRPVYGGAHRRFFALPFHRRQREMFLHYPQPLLLQATVFRTSALTVMGGWREDIISDDFPLFLRMFSKLKVIGQDFEYHPEIMACFYRLHETNVSRNLERQFMTVEQALTKLCPPELRDAAYLRNLLVHGGTALQIGKAPQAVQFFCSAFNNMGFRRLVSVAASEFIESLINGPSRRRADHVEPMVMHEPAAISAGLQ